MRNRITHEQLGRMDRALADLCREVKPVNPRKYAIFAEGFVDQIRQLRAEIDSYLGLNESELILASRPLAVFLLSVFPGLMRLDFPGDCLIC